MIVDTEKEPTSVGVIPFQQQLSSMENVLNRLKSYSERVNKRLRDLKRHVEINRTAINRLQNNQQCMQSLLEDEMEDGDGSLRNIGKEKKVACQEGKRSHLPRTCEMGNVTEMCWTKCKSSTHVRFPEKVEKTRHLLETHRKSNALLSSLKSDLDRARGGGDRRKSSKPVSNRSHQQQLIERVKYIMEMLDNFDFKSTSVMEVKVICKGVLRALLNRQKVEKFYLDITHL